MSEKNQEFVITRIFDAPRELVWQAWTQPSMIEKWFGPKGAFATVVKQEFKVGGVIHTKIQSPGGPEMWGKFTYQEITPPSRLSWLHSFSDENGVNLTRHPFSPEWPLELFTTVVFEEQGDKTKITLTWSPVNPSEIERNVFNEALPGMHQGWGGSFEQLDEFLRNIK